MTLAIEAAGSQQVWGTFDRVLGRPYARFQNVGFGPTTGWSVRFSTMSKYEQDQSIARNAHGL